METYVEFKERRQKEINALPMQFAFNDKQFKDGMAKLGLSEDDTDKVCSIPGGGFMLKTDANLLKDLIIRHEKELKEAFASDTTGTGFMYLAFKYELANYEYCISRDPTDALNALYLTMDEVNNNPVMLQAFKDARS